MAGTPPDPGFAARFRAGITRAMVMGLAPALAERPLFEWDPARVFANADAAGRPWDPEATPSSESTPPTGVRVPCGVQIQGATDEGDATTVGIINADELVLTFLDVHWAQVEGFDRVTVSGRPFKLLKRLPTVGLFDVGVIQVLVGAVG